MQERMAHEAIGCGFWCQIQFVVVLNLDEFSGCTYLYEIEIGIIQRLLTQSSQPLELTIMQQL